MLFKCIIGIPARNRVFIPIAHPAPSPLLALPLLGAAGELLLLPLAQLCSLPSLSDFSSPSHRLLSDSLGMVSGSLQAGLEETTEYAVNHWSQMVSPQLK